MKIKPAVLIVAALFILAPLVVPSWIMFILIKGLFMFIAVLGVTMFLRGGQVTFGHALFYATGTYTVGFSVKWFGFREALVLVPVGTLAGLLMAALVGLIMARYRGVFFAMLNLAFSMSSREERTAWPSACRPWLEFQSMPAAWPSTISRW
jgi:branched-chain amino acid transport system permease protein